MRYDFGSDNTAGMAPSAIDGLVRANEAFARAYGADEITIRAADAIRARLDADAEVRFVFSGTAANAIALSMLAQPYEAVLAHKKTPHYLACVEKLEEMMSQPRLKRSFIGLLPQV